MDSKHKKFFTDLKKVFIKHRINHYTPEGILVFNYMEQEKYKFSFTSSFISKNPKECTYRLFVEEIKNESI